MFALEAWLEGTEKQLALGDEIPANASVIVKRVPGEISRPLAMSKTEDQKIKAWINHVADTWRYEVREANRERRFGGRRRAMGIPSSMLRKAETEDENDRALLGLGGSLVLLKEPEQSKQSFSIWDHM